MSDTQMSDADSLLMDSPPKAKKTAAPKRAGSKPLADVENESHGGDAPSEGQSKNGDASEKYQKVSRVAIAQHYRGWILMPIIIIAYPTRTYHQTS